MENPIKIEDLASILGITEFKNIEKEILRMLADDTTKCCGTGTCS